MVKKRSFSWIPWINGFFSLSARHPLIGKINVGSCDIVKNRLTIRYLFIPLNNLKQVEIEVAFNSDSDDTKKSDLEDLLGDSDDYTVEEDYDEK